jgi:hypothetical protein
MPHVRASIVPINKTQIDYIMKGLYEQIGHHGKPTGALGDLWRKMAEAVRTQKRFIIEVENTDE